jgi:hypothetical protein
MSNAAKVANFVVDSSYRHTLTWDLTVDITAPDLSLQHTAKDVPLAGNWVIYARQFDADDIHFFLVYGKDLAEGALGQVVKTTLELSWVSETGAARRLNRSTVSGPLPSVDAVTKKPCMQQLETPLAKILAIGEKSGGKYVPATHRAYRFTVTLEHSYPDDPKHVKCKRVQLDEQRELAKRVAGVFPHFS